MRKIIFIVFAMTFVFTFCMRAEDDGKLSSTWLPQKLEYLKKGTRLTRLVAKYEPENGAKYYAVQIFTKAGPAPFRYYQVDDQVTSLGEKIDVYATPFGEFIKDAKISQALWNDYFNRWIKEYGREEIQKFLDGIAYDVITKEEFDQFTKAGFKVPPAMAVVEKRQDITLPSSNKPK